MQKRRICTNLLVVFIIGLLCQEGYTNVITCGLSKCDASTEYCDKTLKDCSSCDWFCRFPTKYCQIECPIYFSNKIATTPTSSTPQGTTLTSAFAATDAPPSLPNNSFIYIIFLFTVVLLILVPLIVMILYVALRSVKTDANPQPNGSASTRRAEVSNKTYNEQCCRVQTG